MALFENGFKGNILTGLAIGIGTAIIGPTVIPILANAFKPVAKAAIKGGVLVFEKGKESLAEVSEVVEDIVAEAKAELAAEAEANAAAAGAAGAHAVEEVLPEAAPKKRK